VTANSSVTPLLGDLPVIGALFRSVRYVRDETELVVLVTPRVIGAMEPGQLLISGDLGGPAPDTRNAPMQNPPPFRGRYGFNPAQAAASGRD
jgi:Flp pilus assembly secretin CpaC